MNKVLLTGRLTRDPELRVLASGKNVTTFSVAISPPPARYAAPIRVLRSLRRMGRAPGDRGHFATNASWQRW